MPSAMKRLLVLFGLAVFQASSEESEAMPEVSLLQAHVNMIAEVDEAGQVSTAVARERVRAKLVIEQDLSKLDKSHFRAWAKDESCHTNAMNAFDAVLNANADLKQQFDDDEREQFKARFVEELDIDCKHDDHASDHWEALVRAAIEHQKPAFTQALADSINSADQGYTVEVKPWMRNQSQSDMDNKAGLQLPSEAELLLQLMDTTTALREDTPASFDSRDKVQACRDVVGRIHNQGTCGSCWAFGAMSAIDSRLCISTGGAFSGDRAILSRGYVTSCSKPGNSGPGDGCQGGWFSYATAILKSGTNGISAGVPTGGVLGCSPYFGQGNGEDHFSSQDPAPPCPTQCGNSAYLRSFGQDKYIFSQLSDNLLYAGSGDSDARARQAIYEGGPIGAAMQVQSSFYGYSSGIYTTCSDRPNHAVTAIGYGPDYFDALNSWGEDFGNNGGFRAKDCLFTHWWVPDNLPTMLNPDLPVDGPTPAPTPTSSPTSRPTPAPTPSPPTSVSSWSVESGSCTVDEYGCVMSTNFDGVQARYPNDDSCTINVGANSPAIEVEEFSVEAGWDKLSVNEFEEATASNLHGLVPTTSMRWASDGSVNQLGWKLCPRQQQPSPTTPSSSPSAFPTEFPTSFPSAYPTMSPTAFPTEFPTAFPTSSPTAYTSPTAYPSSWPTAFPTSAPSSNTPDGSRTRVGGFTDSAGHPFGVYVGDESATA
eukprot:TRINITY_DN2481_c0_g1_i1.p1 TRINITY_DN2481_c0_g1~~TRINITY_DN2481_c0_g1_i1.p1  ORF type:complete len:730 (+),score=113.37 TRINITY_DN2481_c0_g1_i1:67-2190(+)